MNGGIGLDICEPDHADSGSLVLCDFWDLSEPQSLASRVLLAVQQGVSVGPLLGWLPRVMVEDFALVGCQIELFDVESRTATLIASDGAGWDVVIDQPRSVGQHWEIYGPLSQGRSLQFSSRDLGEATALTRFGCPMLARAGLMGILWVARVGDAVFGQEAMGPLQHIANCCAIAIHQSQLETTVEHQQTEILKLQTSKDEFLQLLSNELFTPLGSIQLSVQTLERIFKDVSWRKVPQRRTVLKVLSLLSQECRRQKQVVSNLITLMFPEHQKPPDAVLMNLSDWLPSLLRAFEPRFEQEGLKLTIKMPEEPLSIECDAGQLERMIRELVNNAIKYTPVKKTVTITVKATKADMLFAIANTGVQIPARAQTQIFEKFYRIPELDQREYGGSGLGLALVKQLAANLGGTIQVKSTKQKTTFTLQLPLKGSS